MRDRRNVLLALTAGVDDPLGDLGEFRLSLLGYPPQHLESGDVIDTVSHHEDAFGLADTVPGQQCGLQLLSLALGQNRGGGVWGEKGPGGFCVGVPDIGAVTEHIQRAGCPVCRVQLERQATQYAEFDSCRCELRPARLTSEIIAADNRVLKSGFRAGSFAELVL